MAAHRIKRLTLDLVAPDPDLAAALIERCSELHPARIAPLLDRLCDELSGPERVDRIDRVEVDLGHIDPERLDDELLLRLGDALRLALTRALAERPMSDRLAGPLELLTLFARTGNLPWFADRSAPDPVAAALAAVVTAAPDALLDLLRDLEFDEHALARLARHCDAAVLTALLARRFPDLDLAAVHDALERPDPPAPLHALVLAAIASPATASDTLHLALTTLRPDPDAAPSRDDPSRGATLDPHAPLSQSATTASDPREPATPTPSSPTAHLRDRSTSAPDPRADDPTDESSYLVAAAARPGGLPPADESSHPRDPSRPRANERDPHDSSHRASERAHHDSSHRAGERDTHDSSHRANERAPHDSSHRASERDHHDSSRRTSERDPHDSSHRAGERDTDDSSRNGERDPQESSHPRAGERDPAESPHPRAGERAHPDPRAGEPQRAALPADASPRAHEIAARSPPAAAARATPDGSDPTHPLRAPASAARRPDDPLRALRRRMLAREGELHVDDGGLVLLWPFLERLLERLELIGPERRFVADVARHQAIAVLAHLTTLDPDPPEYTRTLAKLLCGHPLEADCALARPLTPGQRDECEHLLAAVIDHAAILHAMPTASFRAAFLARPAVLTTRDGTWTLQVERRPHDAVLERFPWAWSWVKLAWMPDPLRVEW